VPDAEAKARGDSLAAAQVLAGKPGAAVRIKINLPGATDEEVKQVTAALIDEARSAGLVLTPNAPLTIECSISDKGTETANYRQFGAPPFGSFGPFGRRNASDEVKVEKRLSVLSIKENGQELWVATGHYGAPFHIHIKDGQTVQEAANEQKGNPVKFFLTAKIPRYIARHAADGSYGKSKLWP
jgi:hypothetical protein